MDTSVSLRIYSLAHNVILLVLHFLWAAFNFYFTWATTIFLYLFSRTLIKFLENVWMRQKISKIFSKDGSLLTVCLLLWILFNSYKPDTGINTKYWTALYYLNHSKPVPLSELKFQVTFFENIKWHSLNVYLNLKM